MHFTYEDKLTQYSWKLSCSFSFMLNMSYNSPVLTKELCIQTTESRCCKHLSLRAVCLIHLQYITRRLWPCKISHCSLYQVTEMTEHLKMNTVAKQKKFHSATFCAKLLCYTVHQIVLHMLRPIKLCILCCLNLKAVYIPHMLITKVSSDVILDHPVQDTKTVI